MNITLKPYPITKAPKNKWFLEVSFMSGDADAYNTEKYEFKKKEDFEKVYAFFHKFLCFKRANHNLAIDVWVRGKSKESLLKGFDSDEVAAAKYKRYGYNQKDIDIRIEASKACKQSLLGLLGEHESAGQMLEALQEEVDMEICTPHDVTCEGYSASIDKIADMYYYDENGTRFKIEIAL